MNHDPVNHPKHWHQLLTHPDARLIEAAPDMLDVLLRAKDAIEALDGTSAENEKLVDDYRAVLAKVEGTK